MLAICETRFPPYHHLGCKKWVKKDMYVDARLCNFELKKKMSTPYFKCPGCKKEFNDKNKYLKHYEDKHGFVCNLCNPIKLFTILQTYREHLTIYHKIKLNKRPMLYEIPMKNKTAKFSNVIFSEKFSPDPENIPLSFINTLKNENKELLKVYENAWGSIRTHALLKPKKIQDIINFRYPVTRNQLKSIFDLETFCFKVQVSFGFVLKDKETERLRYFHPCQNNAALYEYAQTVLERSHFDKIIDYLLNSDIEEICKASRPNSTWVLERVSNLTFYINKMRSPLIGCSNVCLPKFVTQNRWVVGLVKRRNNKPYSDNLCLFRCLAMGLNLKPFERHAKQMVKTYTDRFEIKNFSGVPLAHLSHIEVCFDVSINVFKLEKNNGKVEAQLVRRTIHKNNTTINVNLYKDHFSYIKDINQFSKNFPCPKCKRLFTRLFFLQRHINTCDVKVKYWFKSGIYQPKLDLFEELSVLNIPTPPIKDCFYPYRCVFDMESYFNSKEVPDNTLKTSFYHKHVAGSVSICSNVPGFTKPITLISNDDIQSLVDSMIDIFYSVSIKAMKLLQKTFKHTIKALNNTIRIEQLNIDKQINFTKTHSKLVGSYLKTTLKPFYNKLNRLKRVLLRLENWLGQLPVIGFNSSKYDINLILPYLVNNFKQDEVVNGKCLKILKRGNVFIAMSNKRLIFIDVLNYLDPGCSYREYIESYDCELQKGYFPYEWFTSLEKLEEKHLPEKHHFKSKLKNSDITDEEYQYCQNVWKTHKMTSMRDFLIWYNTLDVLPLLSALEQHFISYWDATKVDMFKEVLTLPGLSHKFLFKYSDSTITLPNQADGDFYHLMRTNIVGGPSIVFHRYHKVGETRIKHHQYKDRAQICKTIIGQDCNSMYLQALCQRMCSGHLIRRVPPYFKPTRAYKNEKCLQWLLWIEDKYKIEIQHAMSKYGEYKFGSKQICIDGYCKSHSILFQFHGCFFHSHDCIFTDCKADINDFHPIKTDMTWKQVREHSDNVDNYLKSYKNYTTIIMWECEWDNILNSNPDISAFVDKITQTKSFLRSRHPKSFQDHVIEVEANNHYKNHAKENLLCMYSDASNKKTKSNQICPCKLDNRPMCSAAELPFEIPFCDINEKMNNAQILYLIKHSRLFGFILCDVSVPESERIKYKCFPPIFKNDTIHISDIGNFMRDYCEKNNLFKQPRKCLISSFYGEKVLLSTELARKYLELGFSIDEIYEVYEYAGKSCFKWFGDYVIEGRRLGDINPLKKQIAKERKVIGNCGYGKCTLNPNKQTITKYATRDEASKLVNNEFFKNLNEVGDYYEVFLGKKVIDCNLPLTVGFLVYQYAKLFLLEFVYDFIMYYYEDSSYEIMHCDTDSLYCAYSSEYMHDIIKPHLKVEYYHNLKHWIPVKACEKHYKDFVKCMVKCKTGKEASCRWVPEKCCVEAGLYNNRSLGLYKEEAQGDELVCLNSKTYYLNSKNGDKYSCKGVSKRHNDYTIADYFKVLCTQNAKTGKKFSFKLKNHIIYTYSQNKIGLSFLYPKRIVLDDGISTEPLDK